MTEKYYKDLYWENYDREHASPHCCADEYLEPLIPRDACYGKTICNIGMDESRSCWILTFTDGTGVAFIPGKLDSKHRCFRNDTMTQEELYNEYECFGEVRIGLIPKDVMSRGGNLELMCKDIKNKIEIK